ncbi:SDR family NAD(P)-dependent oxidoreductase [Sorangium sp. So ce233]|uniref:SDR family NAD(P)-dependent oxidoreductase n=1 Tax=Sorangium sp. So ce233 TaxID=3133290 RepID=UPI003F5E5F6E
MDLGLKDRVALVTGSSQGIGRATAELLGREGARVVVTYRNHRDKADAVAAKIREEGGDALVVFFDLASDDSIHAAARAAIERWGHIDILVNNAVEWGARAPGTATLFEARPSDEWRTVLRANIEGAYAAIQAVVPSMRERRWGRIVNVSSGLAVNGMHGSAAYSAAKSALHGITRTLYKELAPAGILTNVVMAGLTLTENARANIPEAMREQIAQTSPIKRLPEPHEVATTIAFLASAANTTLNGEILLSSGGHA